MEQDRETEVMNALKAQSHSAAYKLFAELVALRREKHRDKLERDCAQETMGRARECKDLLQFLS